MESSDVTRVEGTRPRTSYVVLQKGAARLEVVELIWGVRFTVGRAASNRIVIPDGKCSRQHCELFSRSGEWYVRDLDSRNGVTVDGLRIQKDHLLSWGETIEIGSHALVFTNKPPGVAADEDELKSEAFEIIERKSGTQFDGPVSHVSGVRRMQKGREGATDLFRIARAMANAVDVLSLARCVLDALLIKTSAEIGGVLLLPESIQTRSVDALQPAALTGTDDVNAFSRFLSRISLEDRDAILAHDVSQHSQLASQESLQKLDVDSAVCAPIRHQGEVLGVIHLYCSRIETPLTQGDLEFTLAVADQMGGHLAAFRDREQLVEGLDRIRTQVAELQDQLGVETELVGHSRSLDSLRRAIARVAPTDAIVLIRGESGVGKELVARAVHFNSQRREAPFVCVNCAALTESLLESELFGHEKGAFTGAAGQRVGKFEQANGGTLFLDEIGEMSPEIQAKFLRVLEGQAFERVGGGKSIMVDVRVVTATNRDLEQEVRESRFRSDLFFRLQVIEIVVPPLREHVDDIPAIAQHFVERFTRKSIRKVRGFNAAAMKKLLEHDWPGNVRELRNVVERAVILAETEVLGPQDVVLTRLKLTDQAGRKSDTTDSGQVVDVSEAIETIIDPLVDLWGSFIQQSSSLDDIDRMYIESVLHSCDWNKSAAARILQIERTTLDRRLKKYGLKRPGDDETEVDDQSDNTDD